MLLGLYRSLPRQARSTAATLRGVYLRSVRYGPETDHLVAEALERERWGAERLRSWQEERLAYIIHRAATRVPYYRDHWMQRRRKGDRGSWEYLENWPILEKEFVRENPEALIADDCDVRRMYHEQTSGTTGKPLDLWFSRKTIRQWYALLEARIRLWYGVSRHDRWANLGGQLITPVSQKIPPFWVFNGGLNQLYMSSYHLSPKLLPYYLDALLQYEVKHVHGYTSSLYELALGALRSGRRDVKMIVAVTNAEPVFDYQREAISEAFQCRVRETYGMSELVAGASECESGVFHLWPDAGFVEIVEGNRLVERGESGDLLCTGLLNEDMPLIRYRLGDRAALGGEDSTCDCGRSLPVLESIEGRIDDVLYTAEGRRVGRLDHVFKSRLPVREAQIVQEALDRIRVRYVPAANFTADDDRLIVKQMQERMGGVSVILESVDELPRSANGKFRAVICNLSREQRELLELESQNP